MKLLNEDKLVWSSVVANCNMNRKRKLTGVNSYEQDLRFDIVKYIQDKLSTSEEVRWGDLCCGEGNALIEAIGYFENALSKGALKLEGIDLVDMFESYESDFEINFQVQSLLDWRPQYKYDLISCVHGLHYIGDKLKVIEKCINALKEDGVFIANIDFANIKDGENKPLKNKLIKKLSALGINYSSRHKLLICEGYRTIHFELNYLGANDKAGANYTGQEVVDSIYEE